MTPNSSADDADGRRFSSIFFSGGRGSAFICVICGSFQNSGLPEVCNYHIVPSEAVLVLVIVIEGLGISATPKIDYEYDYEHEHEKANWQAKRPPPLPFATAHCPLRLDIAV
jgi:hypothetical protein